MAAIAGLVATVAGTDSAHACGPWFPTELLSTRNEAMLELADVAVFTDEARQLLPRPTQSFRVVSGEPEGVRARGTARERDLYESGAEAYHQQQYDLARKAFIELLALPPAERRHRSTWAAYMLAGLRSRDLDAYPRVRQLAADGFHDDLGLAVASLGQEAGHDYHARGDIAKAVRLYAQQAAHGDNSGALSLLFVVRDLIDKKQESRLLDHALGQRLLVLYLHTRSTELSYEDDKRLWTALAQVESVIDADKLAAAAYRRGDWELATELVSRSDTPLARWVKGKLALRAGDLALARTHLNAAAVAFAETGTCVVTEQPAARLEAELAFFALRDGRRRDAMAHAWNARDHYMDVVYIAERMLSIAELRGFVDQLEPEPVESERDWEVISGAIVRGILGRRLMRADRFAEALPHLPTEDRAAARYYAVALARAEIATDSIERARALLTAADLARTRGMEIMGTTHTPDWQLYDGNFNLYGELNAHGVRVLARNWRWRTGSEIERDELSAPSPRRRFHYRYIASQLAERAADELPARSQAFAAALCHSARYVFHRSPDRVRELWSRYVAEGAAVDFSATFGERCPQPELEAARRYLQPAPVRHRWALPLCLTGFLLGGLVLVLGWRRRRRSAWPTT